ncbi:MAG: 3-dehydroquinate synthase [Bdellovibrionaceae bacterium]|nr:3-dehydroquinate synthase [Pseudobdellovibrionaceae bacterium]
MKRRQALTTPSHTKSRVLLRESLPRQSEIGANAVILYDRRLARLNPFVRSWLKAFPATLALNAGEELKSVAAFGKLSEKILQVIGRLPGGRAHAVVALGGGSVGDFAGFFASIYHRGVPLIQIPSTWLAALDSAHGGKTALNVGDAKNQLGTFHPAETIYLVEPLLRSQPEVRVREAMGELVKMALIDGGPWVTRFQSSSLRGADLVWTFLPYAVSAKYKVVSRDPFEKKGIRAILNLGHTLGHVLELHSGLPHGLAVACGLHFAIEWSRRQGLMSTVQSERVDQLLRKHLSLDQLGLHRRPKPVPRETFLRLAVRDKKKAQGRAVKFIFLNCIGRAEPREVSLREFHAEARRTGWAK